MRTRSRVGGGVVAVMLVLVSACNSGDSDDDDETTSQRPSSVASLAIIEPAPGAVVAGGEVTVRLELDGGEIVDQTTRNLRPNEGHIHVTLDGRLVSENYELTAELTVEPGTHVIEAEFVAGDHAPFDPRVVATSTFEAE